MSRGCKVRGGRRCRPSVAETSLRKEQQLVEHVVDGGARLVDAEHHGAAVAGQRVQGLEGGGCVGGRVSGQGVGTACCVGNA